MQMWCKRDRKIMKEDYIFIESKSYIKIVFLIYTLKTNIHSKLLFENVLSFCI